MGSSRPKMRSSSSLRRSIPLSRKPRMRQPNRCRPGTPSLPRSKQQIGTCPELLRTCVTQLRLARHHGVDTGNGAQILVDRFQLMICHALKCGPRHDLQQTTVERVRNTTCGLRRIRGAGGMHCGIEVLPGSHDLYKLRARVPALRLSCDIRSQVASVNVQRAVGRRVRAETLPSCQICRGINFFYLMDRLTRRREKSRISEVFGSRVRCMTAVTIGLRIYDETTQSDEVVILARKV